MASCLKWMAASVGVLALHVGPASAEGLVDPRICERANLSDETRAYCARIADLSGRDLYKATAEENLRRTNQPPLADLEVERVLPRRVDLDASGATDEDGFPTHYTFQLFDGDTGEILTAPVTTREPHASLESLHDLPPNLRASVIVEDDERATDTIELTIPLDATIANCSSTLFACSSASGQTTCSPTSVTIEFSTTDLLDAAQRCDPSITEQTPLVITAAGASGGTGAEFWPIGGSPGGAGGAARLGTTLAGLDSTYGSPSGTTYCYGIGHAGSHGDTGSGAGGAATLVRTCQNVNQTKTTGVLLIAGAGGGGGAAGGGRGGKGGIVLSTTGGSCPPSCAPGSNAEGGNGGSGSQDTRGGDGGGGGTGGQAGSGGCSGGTNGNDGIGGAGGYATHWGTAYWVQGDPKVGKNVGQGGEPCGGGSGGGGFGGGGSGGNGPGGGGGGSYAAKSSVAISDVPGDNSGDGYLQFSFQR